MKNHSALVGRALIALAVAAGLLFRGRGRATPADRRRIKKYGELPGRKFKLGFSFWGYELRAVSIDDSATEADALAVAKFFWFFRGALRPDRGSHTAIVFRDARGSQLTAVGIAAGSLFVFGDPNRPVKPMTIVPVEAIRDL